MLQDVANAHDMVSLDMDTPCDCLQELCARSSPWDRNDSDHKS